MLAKMKTEISEEVSKKVQKIDEQVKANKQKISFLTREVFELMVAFRDLRYTIRRGILC
jgi:hypothetical protein